jgi:hypothetical protein
MTISRGVGRVEGQINEPELPKQTHFATGVPETRRQAPKSKILTIGLQRRLSLRIPSNFLGFLKAL